MARYLSFLPYLVVEWNLPFRIVRAYGPLQCFAVRRTNPMTGLGPPSERGRRLTFGPRTIPMGVFSCPTLVLKMVAPLVMGIMALVLFIMRRIGTFVCVTCLVRLSGPFPYLVVLRLSLKLHILTTWCALLVDFLEAFPFTG